ncbi:MAG: hypothetical protein AB7S71_07845 [Dongiaceae bacterium]
MNLLRALALAVAVASPAAALAADITVGGRVLHIAPPPGFCALDRSNDVDATVFNLTARMQRGYGELVEFWADCQSLAGYRAGQTEITPYVLIGAQLGGNGRVTPVDLPLADYLAEMRRVADKQDGGKTLTKGDIGQIVRQRVDEVRAELGDAYPVEAGETRLLGTIGQDDSAIYIAVLQRLREGGTERHIGGIISMTELNGISATVNLYDSHDGSDSFDAMLGRTKAIVAALVAANPTEGKSRFGVSRLFDGTLGGAIAGAIVAIALGFFLARLRAKK